MRRILTPLFLLALLTVIPLADALAQSSAGRGAVSGAIIGGVPWAAAAWCSRSALPRCRRGEPQAALARPLLLAPRPLLSGRHQAEDRIR